MQSPGKILIMDDDEDLRRLAQSRLERYGYAVETVARGEDALAAYDAAMQSGEPFDLVVLDMVIENGMGGRDTMAHLLDMNPAVKAIASSGHVNEPTMAAFWEAGFSGVLAKPYLSAELALAVRNALNPAGA